MSETKKSIATTNDVFFAHEQLPDNANFVYIIANDGIYRRVRNPLFTATVKAEYEGFGAVQQGVQMHTRIPQGLFREVEAFFRAVYAAHKSEAGVMLTLHKGIWGVYVPEQKVGGASVDYDELPPGLGVAGSIHSHGSMSAFHSGVDDKDEYDFDGVHITIGRCDEKACDYASSVVVGGTRFKCDIKDVVELEPQVFPAEWLEKVKKHSYTPSGQPWLWRQEAQNAPYRSNGAVGLQEPSQYETRYRVSRKHNNGG